MGELYGSCAPLLRCRFIASVSLVVLEQLLIDVFLLFMKTALRSRKSSAGNASHGSTHKKTNVAAPFWQFLNGGHRSTQFFSEHRRKHCCTIHIRPPRNAAQRSSSVALRPKREFHFGTIVQRIEVGIQCQSSRQETNSEEILHITFLPQQISSKDRAKNNECTHSRCNKVPQMMIFCRFVHIFVGQEA